ncbi:Flp family type IVb pilin [Paraburkholderia denitrificans]|uniref:Flp family type IVb pilin n=1 Tax=Paraburkholderia denitrificans TaxID=694025 RepID=A0ABW0JB59_9BURK
MNAIPDLIHDLTLEGDGVTSIEYALLAGLLAVAIIVGATAVGASLNVFFTNVGNWFTGITVP